MTKAAKLMYPVCRNCNTETGKDDVTVSDLGRTITCRECGSTVAHFPHVTESQAPHAQVTQFQTF